MINFSIAGTVVDNLTTDLRGLSDLKIVRFGASFVLVTASEADSAISSFALDASGTPTWVDSQKFNNNSGTGRVSALNFAQVAGNTILLPATRYEDQTSFYMLAENGSLSGPSGAGDSGISGQGIGLNETVVVGGNTYIFVQSYGGQTLTAYALGNNQRLSQVQKIIDTDSSFLGDISAFGHLEINGNSYLFVTSAFDAGLSVYRIADDGRLTLRDTVAPEDGAGFARVQDLASFTLDGQAFVVMAAAGTSSLTVYSVANNGNLNEVTHLIDTLDTRFQNATLVEEFSYDGRQFLVTAGSDDGLTVLEVLPGGALRIEASLADTFDITLDNISAIAISFFNDVPVLYVSSATEHGFTRIELDIVPPPKAIEGTAGNDRLEGTDGDDLIKGYSGNDTLLGGAGDDTLVDGAGKDQLFGSGGADIFTFVKDGDTDTIIDFNPDWDVIDLSAFGGITSFSDLRILQGCAGILMYVEGEFIVLEIERHHVEIADLTAGHFIF